MGSLTKNHSLETALTTKFNVLILLIISFIVIRLISLGLYPLFDTTEARYGEIARIMVETGNWLTPHFDYQTPFWGKPPMHTWLSAIGFEAFGISEFGARVPHFFAGIATVFILSSFAKHFFSTKIAHITALILLSSLGFIIAVGMVMTDAVLTLSITLAMASFWRNYQKEISAKELPKDGIIFFIALSIGMLVKGPVAIVIVAIALVTWSLTNRCFVKAICSLPWVSGITVFLLLTLPWYVMAELSTPGFLEYFLWGEHVQRFIQPGWQGDLYGTAHDEIKGTIWIFAIAMAFPWSFIALYFIFARLKNIRDKKDKKTVLQCEQQLLNNYLISWLLAPMLLFTFAGNILPAYVLPALPVFALWLAPKFRSLKPVLIASTSSLVLLVIALVYITGGFTSKTSQVQLIGKFDISEKLPLYYWQKRPFSAQFYSQGKAKLLNSDSQLEALINDKKTFLLVLRLSAKQGLSNKLKGICQETNSIRKYTLLQCY